MEIEMYNCVFGDCFKITKDTQVLYVDFGIHFSSYSVGDRKKVYNSIIKDMPCKKDFVLTHYHSDHYEGAIYMMEKNVKFDDVYIPDIWGYNCTVDAKYLEPLYPRTAQIYYGLYDMYKKESDIERSDAENGR